MSFRSALLVLVIALTAWIVSLVRTWDGYTGMNHTAGTVAALADATLHEEAPGAERSGVFLGTIYAPPFPLLVAALHGSGMSWRAALRWASLLSAVALLAAVFAAAVATGGSAAGAAVALALIIAAFPFKAASLAGRADLLAAACSIAALAAWNLDREQRGWLTAMLAALGWLTKLSTLTLPVAIVIWAVNQQQAVPAIRFVARFVLFVALGTLVTLPFHGAAWYSSALGTLLASPPNTGHALRGPAELLRYLGAFAELAAAAALALAFVTSRETRHRPVRSFAVATLALALVVLSNRGSDHNHLIELAAFAAVAGGIWCERIGARAVALPAALVTVVVCAASWRDLQSFNRQADDPAARRDAVLAAVRADTGSVFAEDPLVVLAAGRRSPLADPATFRSLERDGDRAARRMVADLAAGRWSLVVLETDLETGAPRWYHDFHLGDDAVTALRERYEKRGNADGYVLYARRVPPADTLTSPAAPPVAPAPVPATAPVRAGRRSRR